MYKKFLLRSVDGTMFALAPVDDFEVEVELLKNNAEFMAYLTELSCIEGNNFYEIFTLRS